MGKMSSSRRRLAEIAHRWYYSVFSLSDNADDERAYLLNTTTTFRTTCCEKAWILVLAVVLIVGVSASTYLLIVEGKDPTPKSFTLVPRKDWTPRTSCGNASKFQLPIQRILLLPTNTTECWTESECSKELRNLQKGHVETLNETDIPYNFVLAGDNRIYEGRGWNCSSSFENSGVKLLTIPFLGKYDDRPPTAEQVKSLEAFLEYAVMQNTLSNCYQIVSRDSTAGYITYVAFELESRREKNIC